MDNYQIPQNPVYNQPVTQPITQSTPANQSGNPSASAVNIIIQNPTANPAPSFPSYPSNYYMQQPVYNMLPNNAYPQATPAVQTPAPAAPVAAAPIEKEETSPAKTEEKKSDKTKKVVQLTDDYIKSLENYLRTPNKDVRLMAAKELSKRFSEDDSRRGDKALNSLLNLVLQDKASDVRALGLAIANAGLAQGDETTATILKNMQSSDSGYGQDALMATNALLKMAGNIVEIPDNSPDKKEK